MSSLIDASPLDYTVLQYKDHNISTSFVHLIQYKDSETNNEILWSAEGNSLGSVYIRDLQTGKVLQVIPALTEQKFEEEELKNKVENEEEEEEKEEDEFDPSVEQIFHYLSSTGHIILYIVRAGNLSSYILKSKKEIEEINNERYNLESFSSYSFHGINSCSLNSSLKMIAISDNYSRIFILPIDNEGKILLKYDKINRKMLGNILKKDEKVLHLEPIHNSILGSLLLSSAANKLTVYGGGYDCLLACWNDIQNKLQFKKREIMNISEEYEEILKKNKKKSNDEIEEMSSNQIINPPFVQVLKFVKGNSYLGLGLGDGSV